MNKTLRQMMETTTSKMVLGLFFLHIGASVCFSMESSQNDGGDFLNSTYKQVSSWFERVAVKEAQEIGNAPSSVLILRLPLDVRNFILKPTNSKANFLEKIYNFFSQI